MAIPYYNAFGGPGSPAPKPGEVYVYQHTKNGGFVVEKWNKGDANPVQHGGEYADRAAAEEAAKALSAADES